MFAIPGDFEVSRYDCNSNSFKEMVMIRHIYYYITDVTGVFRSTRYERSSRRLYSGSLPAVGWSLLSGDRSVLTSILRAGTRPSVCSLWREMSTLYTSLETKQLRLVLSLNKALFNECCKFILLCMIKLV